ncbi:type 2 isopentenyl-diphosphate Delta-isomerase [Anaeromyxobacter diazotrophicus]|uniref:Isopentenyl-diphosphate delta-isomerase n=1 Tax=Anaeromyxobacter diazotrophicus TaxID=2590199 RepID=A0A7I9VNZ8_9BACT|nr:type 2 isopentenyl-diphosphate Delta-isomerase [Anaeromyxobacter diazotrophicus]GEJ58136.1 isopentenyl-diphosphate delta-isomerase [Anaeromyxobacter diazotrophicus]
MDRKDSHLTLCLTAPVELGAGDASGFGGLRFEHDALPEVDRAAVTTETELLGKRLAAPLVVGAMTGGTPRAGELNQRLAKAAEACGVGFALGSQRRMLEDPSTRATFAVREVAPGLRLLFGNVGAVQLNYGVGAAEVRRLVEAVGCDAFNFHLNPLQEAIQPEGDTRFAGLVARLREVAPAVGVPVLLKEVGAGISRATALKIRELPVAGVETAGVGGTSWARIESLRTADPVQRSTGELFARWGIPTAESVATCRAVLPDRVVIASGGIRNGIEAAKALALGADAVALALPLLKAAERSTEEAVLALRRVIEELRTAMFVTGCRTVPELRLRPLVRARDLTAQEPA